MAKQEFEIQFFDRTMLEANGLFKKVKNIIESEFPYPEEWTVSTRLILASKNGIAEMLLDFNQDKNLYIIEYSASTKNDIYLNQDLTSLSFWSQKAGWNVPIPHPNLVRSNLNFWMHWWKSGIVDSQYLEDLYGKRDHIRKDDDDND